MTAIKELLDRYCEHAKTYYATNPGEIHHIEAIRACILSLEGAAEDVAGWGPKQLKAAREAMVAGGWQLASGTVAKPWCRSFVNSQVSRLKGIFRWGVEEEIVPETIAAALSYVAPLAKGRTNCREGKGKVCSAPAESVLAAMDHMNDMVKSMVKLQQLSGMRSGEMCMMRPCDLTVRDDVWLYAPKSHKTLYKGKTRIIALGPRSVEIVRPRLSLRTQEPLWRYSTISYRNAVYRACDRAGVERFHPHQLRHLAATIVRERFGEEAVQHVLGHSHLSTSAIYGEKAIADAIKVAREVG